MESSGKCLQDTDSLFTEEDFLPGDANGVRLHGRGHTVGNKAPFLERQFSIGKFVNLEIAMATGQIAAAVDNERQCARGIGGHPPAERVHLLAVDEAVPEVVGPDDVRPPANAAS